MGINARNSHRGILTFDMPDGEFELLETEQGEPGYWGGWRERPQTPKQSEAPDDIVDTVAANRKRL